MRDISTKCEVAKRSEAGYSLVSTMVAMGMAGLVALLVAKTSSQMVLNSQSAELSVDENFAKLAVLRAINYLDCGRTFGANSAESLQPQRNFALRNSSGRQILPDRLGIWKVNTSLLRSGGELRFSVELDPEGAVDPLTKREKANFKVFDLNRDGADDYDPCQAYLAGFEPPAGTRYMGNLRGEPIFAPEPVYRAVRRSGGSMVTSCCPQKFNLTGCSGSREENLRDTCDEENCGFIGTGVVLLNGRMCCRASIDSDSGTEATAVAFCMQFPDQLGQ